MPRLCFLLVLGAAATTLAACADDSPLAAPAGVAGVAAADATDGPVFTSILYPGAAGTFALDINSRGEIVGRYQKSGVTHGFLRDADGEMSTIDFPGSVFTVAAGINDRGDIVGMYATADAPTHRHGYLLRDGEFTSFDPPGSTFTNALGIDERGLIVGRYCTLAACGRPGSTPFHAFKLEDGEITTIDYPGSIESNGWKPNSQATIVGGWRDATHPNTVFTLEHGEFTAIDLPGSPPVGEDNGGINERGDIVGIYCDASPCDIVPTHTHGFLLHEGELTTIDFPGAAATGAFGINARGDIAGGYYDTAGMPRGYLVTGLRGER